MNKKFLLATLAAALTAAFAASHASAAIIFATFSDPATSQPFSFTNNTTSGTISASTAVDFEFTTASGLPTTVHSATLTISGPATTTAGSTAGSLLNQPLSGVDTLSIIETGTNANLLTMTFNGNIIGVAGGPSASVVGADTTGNTVTYTSSLLTFTGPGNSYNLGLGDSSVPLTLGAGGFLSSLVANIDGQFTAGNASGGGPGTPEPASLGILSLGALALLTRRRNA
jgi:hypothetical protein